MIKAIVTNMNVGYPGEREHASAHLAMGKIFNVIDVDIGQSYTAIIIDVNGKAMSFNSAFFDFEENGEPLNIQ